MTRLRLGLEAVISWARVRALLARHPPDAVLARLRAQRPMRPPVPADPARCARVTQRVLGRLPGDTRCLTRSLVLVRMLARRGVAARVVLAVRPGETFAAHAWVEVAGRAYLPTGGTDFTRLTEL